MGVSHNPFTLTGRMHRTSYICIIVILFILSLILNAFLWDVYDRLMAGTSQGFDIACAIVILAIDVWMLEIYFAVTVKRLRDIKANGWWSLLNLIPIVNVILFIVLAVFPSRHHEDDIKSYAVPQVQPGMPQQPNIPPSNYPGNQ